MCIQTPSREISGNLVSLFELAKKKVGEVLVGLSEELQLKLLYVCYKYKLDLGQQFVK